MELDLLGLGLPAAAASGGCGGSPAQRPHDQTALDEPLRADGTAAETPSLPMSSRARPCPADMDGDVLAPPANMLKPTSTMAAPWPAAHPSSPKLGYFLSGMCQVAPPATASDPAAGQGQARAVAMRAAPPQTAGCPAANAFVGRPPVPAAAAARSILDDSTTMTIIYDGSVRVFYKVPMEQAEKILSVVSKHAQAAETPPVQQPHPNQPRPQPAAATATPSSAMQMMIMLWRLGHLEDNLVPKRTASLARFLDKRKQRVDGAAAAPPYPRGDGFPAQMDAYTTVSARNEAAFGGMERPLASEDSSKSMKENHGEEAVNTELKI